MEAILGYISMLKEADTGETATMGKIEMINVLRKDENGSEKNTEPKNLIDTAPFYENNFVKVKHVFE